MAARTSKVILNEKWREKIRASELLNSLRDHVLGHIKMSSTQVRAAEILLRKVIPDLSSTDNKTELIHNYVARLPAPVRDSDEWLKQYSPPIIN